MAELQAVVAAEEDPLVIFLSYAGPILVAVGIPLEALAIWLVSPPNNGPLLTLLLGLPLGAGFMPALITTPIWWARLRRWSGRG